VSNGTPWLEADWPAPPGVRAFTTLRQGAGGSRPPFDRFNMGNRTSPEGDDPAQVQRNRDELVRLAGLPSLPHWLRQVHGVEVLRFERPVLEQATPSQPPPSLRERGGAEALLSSEGDGRSADSSHGSGAADALPPPLCAAQGRVGEGSLLAEEPTADASVTSTAGVVLAILTADCLPVLFAAKDGSEVAAAHAGWRGLADGMLEATLAAMRTPAAEVVAWLGPAAGPAHYEIGSDVHDAFLVHSAQAEAAFTATRPGHWRVDLYALARQRLQAAGMDAADIHGGNQCTIADPSRWFSHRRDRRSGRMATLVWMQR